MASFFPMVTGTFRMDEPSPARRFVESALAMGALTGALVRLYRALTLSVGPTENVFYVGAALVLGQLFILGMATLHLGNFTLKRWIKLVPLFALSEIVAEALVSLLLIALGWERLGSVRATMAMWPGIAGGLLAWRLMTIGLFSALLAGVVQLVRTVLARRHRHDADLRAD